MNLSISPDSPKTRHLVMMLVCSTIFIFASQAAAFSSGEEAQSMPEIGVGGSFHSSNPSLITDRSRDPAVDNDFMRITFLPASVGVTSPGRPGVALRAFFGSTRFYDPPIEVEQIADFNGFAPDAGKDLVAMRCRPATPDADPFLATWPNLSKMLITDLADQHYSCPPSSIPGNIAFCLAQQYSDPPVQPVVTALINALQFGQQLFLIESGDFLNDAYGINANNSGLGFVVKGLPVPLSAAETLEQSVVPEYLLRNINLADGNCRCIRVAPYPGRDQDVLPAKTVWNKGKLGPGGLCSSYVKRLPHGH